MMSIVDTDFAASDGVLAASAGPEQRTVPRGGLIYASGDEGRAWRIVSGSARLDRDNDVTADFGGLAVAGDVIGAETLMFGRYNFSARALVPCVLEPWPDETPVTESLFQALLQMERRTTELLAVRSGSPIERVRRFVRLLAAPSNQMARTTVMLPPLRDMAEITCLSSETFCRVMSKLRRQGEVVRLSRNVALLPPNAAPASAEFQISIPC